jgi:transposase
MHIQIIPNRGSTPTVLLRESYREGSKVGKRTLANLSSLSGPQIEAIRCVLRGDKIQFASKFEILSSRAHGHVQAVSLAMSRLKMDALIDAKDCPQRDAVLAMIASRIVSPNTKLATTRLWHTNTLASDFGVTGHDEDDLYKAMDWLLERQDSIEKKLAKRHLLKDALVLYDLSSSYFEGSCCPLAKFGYNRDRKRGKLQVNYGLLTGPLGCPVAISVYEGNTSDGMTFMPAVHKLQSDFGIKQMVMVGDRGMIAQKTINEMRDIEGLDWITALRTGSIRALVEGGQLQMGLFDERNLLEIESPDYPGERLVACRNDALSKLRAHKRLELLSATEENLTKIKERVDSGRLTGADAIGVCVGRLIDKHKMAKHIELKITNQSLTWTRKAQSIAAEAALDGLYIIRTSVSAQRMDAPTCVRSYKSLANVERAFRSIKSIDLKVRPIHHRTENRVRAHLFLCMLAYYVEWHMRQAWAELLFADTEQGLKESRDPVAPAKRSEVAMQKVASLKLDDGSMAHSFATLMADLSTIVQNTCKAPGSEQEATTFEVTTNPTLKQQRAMELIKAIKL